jgi:hypothetical protein
VSSTAGNHLRRATILLETLDGPESDHVGSGFRGRP